MAGCTGSPTYGTGKTANMQLLEDVTGMMSVGDKKRDPINYAPRPELVKPGENQQMALVAPQDNIVATSATEWPESPEARLARIKADATANQDNPSYRAPVIMDTANQKREVTLPKESIRGPGYDADEMSANEREMFRKRLAEAKQGSATTRKYLSEPPVAYRAPEATAATGDIGEDEWKKERRAKRSARKKGGLRDILPW